MLKKPSFKMHPVITVLRIIVLIIIIVVGAYLLDFIVSFLLKGLFHGRVDELTAYDLESFIAAFAAVLVFFELREGQKQEKRENSIQEASFVFQYNQAFITDENMARVESRLEEQMVFKMNTVLIDDDNTNRQEFINYLVYLEGLAPVILNDVMTLSSVDDLMAYRFFLAVNNPELQKKELGAFPQYYAGCYKLYAKWKEYYDEETKRGNIKKIPFYETSLDKLPCYSLYAEKLVIKQLKNGDDLTEDNYKSIARLIYNTDQYIYPAIFGAGESGIQNAEKVLPDVFRSEKDAMFCNKNLFVVFSGDDIIGLILWVKKSFEWNPEALLSAFRENNIEYKEDDIEKVKEEYFDHYSLRDGKTISLLNICVDSFYRNMCLGQKMMTVFINEHLHEKIELCVLKDNEYAIKLYRNTGFTEVGLGKGFSLVNEKPDIVNMERKPDPRRVPDSIRKKYDILN